MASGITIAAQAAVITGHIWVANSRQACIVGSSNNGTSGPLGFRSSPLNSRGVGSVLEGKSGTSSTQLRAGWFKFGSNGMDSEGAGIYGSQKREDFDRDDVEQYFNYMGMLATEGTYDKMEALLNTGIEAVDILLLMAASEGDKPKIEELLEPVQTAA